MANKDTGPMSKSMRGGETISNPAKIGTDTRGMKASNDLSRFENEIKKSMKLRPEPVPPLGKVKVK